MYNDKTCYGIIFDPSYVVHRIDIPMGIIYSILNSHKDSYFVYCGIERLCWHVENYAKALKIQKERLIKICLPLTPSKTLVSIELMSKWINGILQFGPERLYVFRDNTATGLTTSLIRSCVNNKITVTEYDNRGLVNNINNSSVGHSKWYRTDAGRIYHP
ncbi:MAG: hypothetical protein IJ193_00160 [Bacilli bacterium]|nr:hypothetical protein [Bacilli bacterium]